MSGGGKRARGYAEKSMGTKDLKQSIQEYMVQLRAMENKAPVVEKIMEEVDAILEKMKTSPTGIFGGLLGGVPKSALSLILTSTLSSSPRAFERVKFIAENTLPDVFEGLGVLTRQHEISTAVLCQTIQLAIHMEYADQNGGIAWQKFLKEVADVLATRSDESIGDDANRCEVM
eukprot:Skav222386  [mRNA]  locus=scaffold1202:7623:8144:- [translate_table: standard]